MTLRDWAVLLKVARGEAARPCHEVDRLIVHGVVHFNNGRVVLTGQGRIALGLPVQHDAAGTAFRPQLRTIHS